MAKEKRTFLIEQRSVDFVPENERHGSVFSLFTLWFSANMQITTVVTGALAVVLGLPLLWAIVAIILGNALGGIFMALHSAQGPRMGIPQMIQSRAQFGFYGAILPLILVIILYIGFFASSGVLGGQALAAWTGLPVTLSIIIIAALCTVLAIFGYTLIHRYEGIASVLFLIGFLYLTARLLLQHGTAQAFTTQMPFTFGTFLLVISITAAWQLTYGPYVSDYSRYLPYHTSLTSSFWWTYLGSVLSSIWMMSFGCIAVAIASKQFQANSVSYVVAQAGQGFGGIMFLLIILGIISANVLNLYGFFMTTTTAVAVQKRFHMGVSARIAFVVGAAIIGTAVAILGQGNFLTNYENFLNFLLYFLLPWSAINIVDFYFVRHEHYDIQAIFDPHGIYGLVNWRTLLVYVIAVLCELPFANTSIYVGFISPHLGGADIAWIVGLIVSGGLYYLLARGRVDQPVAQQSFVPTTDAVEELNS
jgi:NCS1 family nucleobase:cation symporter-1